MPNKKLKIYIRARLTLAFVNDYEEQTVTSGTTNSATKAWYTELNSLTTNRILFYSYSSFAQTYAATAMTSYDGFWLASYTLLNQPKFRMYSGNTRMIGIVHQSPNMWMLVCVPLKATWFLSTASTAGKAISYKKYVSENTAKSSYTIWGNLTFTKKLGKTAQKAAKTYYAKYEYKHSNGSTYLSLYDKNGKWVGYVNANSMTVMTGHAYKHTATIYKTGYSVWNNFLWAKVKHYTKII